MDEQFTLSGFETVKNQEIEFLKNILPALRASISKYGGDEASLTYKKCIGYTAVFFVNLTAFRLHLRGNQHYIALPTVFSDLLLDSFPVKKVPSDPKFIRILVDEVHPIYFYRDFLVQVIGETVNRYPKEWDCCSRYLECSDAKKCVHPDKNFALKCGYRKILRSGRVFYGENRNID